VAAVCVFCASSTTIDECWLELAREVGVALAAAGHSLVSGGGRVGMMGTVAAGTRSAEGYTLGVIPEAMVGGEVADTGADELVVTDDMASRKNIMIERSDGFLVLPGGLGTLDEFFEVWTTAMLGLHDKPVILLNVDGFYSGLLDWVATLTLRGFVRATAMESLVVVGTVAEALDALGRCRTPTV
jgi:uncharacterized protein (TIGR00730 family)